MDSLNRVEMQLFCNLRCESSANGCLHWPQSLRRARQCSSDVHRPAAPAFSASSCTSQTSPATTAGTASGNVPSCYSHQWLGILG
eukprot:3928872-Amphidinium_carterae.1